MCHKKAALLDKEGFCSVWTAEVQNFFWGLRASLWGKVLNERCAERFLPAKQSAGTSAMQGVH